MTERESESYEGWAIVEAMGHQQVAGKVSESVQYGTPMLRVDVYVGPETDDGEKKRVATQFYGGSSIYRLTPCDEATALRAMQRAADLYTVPEVVRLAVRRHEESTAALAGPEQDFDHHGDADGD